MSGTGQSETLPERVLLLHDYGGDRGGAEQIALDLRRLLKDRGVDARLLTSSADGWTPETAPDYVVKGGRGAVHSLRETWNSAAGRGLADVLAEFRPDVAHIVMFLTQLSPSILPPLERLPTVYSANTYRVICPSGLRWYDGGGVCDRSVGLGCARAQCLSPLGVVPRLIQNAMAKKWRLAIDRIVVPSQKMTDILQRHGWAASDLVPHAVPEHHRQTDMGQEPLLAFAGRLVPEKGVDWLLRAFAQSKVGSGPGRLVIMGDGPDRPRLEGIAAELGLGTSVVFTGHLARATSQQHLEAAWVQAVPSLWAEPFGLVAAEALARGTPVIASDAGAPAEIVEHGATGWVVKTGDTQALSDTIDAALADRSVASKMGQAGRRIASGRYSETRWIERYLEIYAELLAGPRAEGVS